MAIDILKYRLNGDLAIIKKLYILIFLELWYKRFKRKNSGEVLVLVDFFSIVFNWSLTSLGSFPIGSLIFVAGNTTVENCTIALPDQYFIDKVICVEFYCIVEELQEEGIQFKSV